jgi:hypothetical protein
MGLDDLKIPEPRVPGAIKPVDPYERIAAALERIAVELEEQGECRRREERDLAGLDRSLGIGS